MRADRGNQEVTPVRLRSGIRTTLAAWVVLFGASAVLGACAKSGAENDSVRTGLGSPDAAAPTNPEDSAGVTPGTVVVPKEQLARLPGIARLNSSFVLRKVSDKPLIDQFRR